MDIDEIKKIASVKGLIESVNTSNLKPEEKFIFKEAADLITIASKIDKISEEEQKDFIIRTRAITFGFLIGSNPKVKGEIGEPQNIEDQEPEFDYQKCVKSCLAIYEQWHPEDRPYGLCAAKCAVSAVVNWLKSM